MHYQHVLLSKEKRLTSIELKKMIYKEIEKKQKQVDPTKHNMRIVDDNLPEVETMQFILTMITDEERLRETKQPQINFYPN